MDNKRKDIYSGVAMLLFAAFFYGTSFLIQATTSDILGSRFFPQMAAILIALLAVVQIIQACRKPAPAQEESASQTETAGKKRLSKPLVLTTLALFAYYLLTLAVGFTLTSIAYLFFEGMVLMDSKNRKDKKKVALLAVVSVVIPVFLNTVFWNVFAIALPAGALFEML